MVTIRLGYLQFMIQSVHTYLADAFFTKKIMSSRTIELEKPEMLLAGLVVSSQKTRLDERKCEHHLQRWHPPHIIEVFIADGYQPRFIYIFILIYVSIRYQDPVIRGKMIFPNIRS